MRHHLAALVVAASLVTLASASSAPASAADAKSEALSLIGEVRGSLEDLASRAEAAAARVGTISGAGRNRDLLEVEVGSLASDLASLDAKLKVLDLRVSGLSATSSKRSASAATSTSSSKAAASSSGGLRVACEVSDRTVGLGGSVVYTANVSGGSKPYAYEWSGAFQGNSATQKASFVDAGTYKEKLTVTDRSKRSASDDCPNVDVAAGYADGVDDDGAMRARNAKISLLEPSSGARLVGGTAGTIRWKTSGLASGDRLDVFLVKDGVFYYIATSLDKGNSGSSGYTWPSVGAVAADFVPYGDYTLKVCTLDGEVCGATKVTLARPS